MCKWQVAVQRAGSELFRFGALAWELSRLCSMLAPALAGAAQVGAVYPTLTSKRVPERMPVGRAVC